MKLDFLKHFEFFVGVPDSLLAPLCSYIIDKYGIGKQHIIAANEGNAVALAAGYHLATGRVPLVYMQNSGEGNIVNPVVSLMNNKVYGIPCVFVIGWRGEPDVPDEPQHLFQGEITIKLLKDMEIATFVVSKNTTNAEIEEQLQIWKPLLKEGKQVAFIIKKGAMESKKNIDFTNGFTLSREQVIGCITEFSREDSVISTTGKASRELFEIREKSGMGHGLDFLTVGSMGHSSSIALGIALAKPHKKIWCIDGDGAALMHLGGMAVIGAARPKNLIHIIINNQSHETVGGMPTVAGKISFTKIAEGCGYPYRASVETLEELVEVLAAVKRRNALCLVEVKCSIGSCKNLGRPTTSPKDNKKDFMERLKKD